jgi:multiple sugar transport system permease protein
MLHDSQFWRALSSTAQFSAIAGANTLFGSLFVALVLNEVFPGRGFVRRSPVIAGALWARNINGQSGVLDAVPHRVGIVYDNMSWLAEPGWALPLVRSATPRRASCSLPSTC